MPAPTALISRPRVAAQAGHFTECFEQGRPPGRTYWARETKPLSKQSGGWEWGTNLWVPNFRRSRSRDFRHLRVRHQSWCPTNFSFPQSIGQIIPLCRALIDRRFRRGGVGQCAIHGVLGRLCLVSAHKRSLTKGGSTIKTAWPLGQIIWRRRNLCRKPKGSSKNVQCKFQKKRPLICEVITSAKPDLAIDPPPAWSNKNHASSRTHRRV